MYDILIIGSGPAGLSAAVYAARAQHKAVVIEKMFMGTGQIAVTDRVDNYLGLPGINGYDLGEKFREHALSLGAEFMEGEVSAVKRAADGSFTAVVSGREVSGKSVIYAAGTANRRLGVEGEGLNGVSYCAVCDGMFYKGKTVAVVGGGDTALGDAVYLSRIADKVYLIHRREDFRANRTLIGQVKNAPNIELVLGAVVSRIKGGKRVESIEIVRNGEHESFAVNGVFTAIGSVPNTSAAAGLDGLVLEGGYIAADETGKTSVPGFYAAGDVRTKHLRQVITAAADGASCAVSADEYLSETE